MSPIAWFYWNPNRIAFTIPFIEHPIVWYGVFFVSGFFLGYLLLIRLLTRMTGNREQAANWSDQLVWFTVIGTIVGARLGHVFFYGWSYFQHHLIEILYVWQGGLASHGGAIGVLLSIALFLRKARKEDPHLTFLALLDRIAIPTAFVGCCIRIGNFWNQEIVGKPSELPWAVLFGSPFDGSALVPRHPVQLYEAAAYLFTFVLLLAIWYRRGEGGWRTGSLFGLFMVVVFSARFVLESYKESLKHVYGLDMGQWLSIPFVIAGLFLLYPRFQPRTCP